MDIYWKDVGAMEVDARPQQRGVVITDTLSITQGRWLNADEVNNLEILLEAFPDQSS